MSAGDREHLGHGNGHAAGNGNGSASSLDAYLDGRLAGAERTAFEARLAGDPVLAAGLDAQRRIDGSLRRMFVVPPPAPLPVPVPLPINGPGSPVPARGGAGPSHAPRAAAAVAGLAISAAAGDAVRRWTTKTLLLGVLTSGLVIAVVSWVAYNATADRRQTFDDVYRQLAAAPVQPAGMSGFESACRRSLGHQVAVVHPPPGVEVLGVGEAKVISEKTVVLRARVDGMDVMLFADRAAHDDGSAAAARNASGHCGLHLFRRESGGVVFYELTPHAEPRLLDPYAGPPATNPAPAHDCSGGALEILES